MHIVIAGGHGKVALRLEKLLAGRGDEPVGIIRDPAQAGDLREHGAEPLVLDLERTSAAELADHLGGADAVVFAAGAGGKGPRERTEIVDHRGAVMLADAAERAGVRRYVMVSSMGAGREPDPGTDPGFATYLRAKTAAEDDVRPRPGLDVTIVRPGMLRDEPGTGRVLLTGEPLHGAVPRDDVAAVLAEILRTPGTAGHTFELIAGDTPVPEAVAAAV